MQFPWYFGENWDALAECLTDLDWLPADQYVLAIDQADQLLAHEPSRELRTLFDLLAATGDFRLGDAAEAGTPARQFRVVLQVDPADRPAMLQRFEIAGIELQPPPAHGA